jgi:tRNA threonylcarbamoyladenosine biosynthesis protein TsaE
MNRGRIILNGLAETARLGSIIGASVAGGDLIYLDGDLGAGKTTLTKSIADGLGISPSSVTSPTFTLVHEYTGGRIPLYHFDLYRLIGGHDLDNLGFDEYLGDESGAIVVEWAAKAADRLPGDALSMHIKTDINQAVVRTLEVTTGGLASARLLERIMRLYGC